MSSSKFFFAAEEMRDTGDIDPEAIRAVDMPVRTVAAGPARELQKSDAIFLRSAGRETRPDGRPSHR